MSDDIWAQFQKVEEQTDNTVNILPAGLLVGLNAFFKQINWIQILFNTVLVSINSPLLVIF